MILNWIVFAISSINSFAFMGILNAIIGIVFLFTSDRVGALAIALEHLNFGQMEAGSIERVLQEESSKHGG